MSKRALAMQAGREELVKRAYKSLSQHKDLLELFLRDLDDQVEVVNTFEDFAGPEPSEEFADDTGHHFAQASVFAKVGSGSEELQRPALQQCHQQCLKGWWC